MLLKRHFERLLLSPVRSEALCAMTSRSSGSSIRARSRSRARSF